MQGVARLDNEHVYYILLTFLELEELYFTFSKLLCAYVHTVVGTIRLTFIVLLFKVSLTVTQPSLTLTKTLNSGTLNSVTKNVRNKPLNMMHYYYDSLLFRSYCVYHDQSFRDVILSILLIVNVSNFIMFNKQLCT